MTFALTKKEAEERNRLAAALREAGAVLTGKITDFNAELQVQRDLVEEALATYNEIVVEAREFAEGIASRADDEINGKSEKWQEGEKGEAASNWKDQWESIEMEDHEIEFPEPLDEPGLDHADNLDEPATEMED